jgi:hypothetical protein
MSLSMSASISMTSSMSMSVSMIMFLFMFMRDFALLISTEADTDNFDGHFTKNIESVKILSIKKLAFFP